MNKINKGKLEQQIKKLEGMNMYEFHLDKLILKEILLIFTIQILEIG